MTDAPARLPTDWKAAAMTARIKRRYRGERLFRLLGLGAVLLSAGFLVFLLWTMVSDGARGFTRTEIAIPFDLKAMGIDAQSAAAGVGLTEVPALAADRAFGAGAGAAVSDNGWLALRSAIQKDPSILTQTTTIKIPASSPFALAERGAGNPASQVLYKRLADRGVVTTGFNTGFLTNSDATDPIQAGIWGAFKGSLLTMLVTLLLAFPVGVLSALYLEEYAPKNRWTDLIEVSINNLAAVPSIIFGLLGLAVFLNIWGLPRSAPIVGGLTLALMTMPVIVIAGRNAIKAVPPSIRDAALGIGASPIQVVFHHVLPLALPGILTGTIIGMARALGETAPLLMIGMRAFVATPPGGIADPATVLPVQIFLWSDEVSKGFIEKTSAAIIVLLVFLLAMNAVAIYLRNRFETRW
jgi:phosphate transport system permease protein